MIERNVESVKVAVGARSNIQKTVRSNSFGGRGFTDSSAKMFAVGEKELGRKEGRKGGRGEGIAPRAAHTAQVFSQTFCILRKAELGQMLPPELKRRDAETDGPYLRVPRRKALCT